MNIKELKKFGIDGPTEGKLIIDLSTEWCGPCKFVSPILEKLRDEGLINLINIDIDENHEKLNISAVPTLLFFKDGELLGRDLNVDGRTLIKSGIMIGATSEYYLRELIQLI